MVNLGKLEEVDIRTVWKNEGQDFTPWLQENIDRLSESIGYGIIDLSREQSVGKYWADLVGTLEGSDKIVVVENQFGETDHDHLGKLLTYTAGKNAKVAIWIAESFRPEHIAALENLNENMGSEGISFFGIEIKLRRIGNSPPAAEFLVVAKPNEWQRQVSQQPLSESDVKRNKLRFEFFSKLADKYKELNPSWNKVKAAHNHWLSFGAGKAGFSFSWVFKWIGSGTRFSVELYIDTRDQEENKKYFNQLKERKEEIEKALGFELFWDERIDSRFSRIECSMPTETVFTKLSEKRKDELVEWGSKTMLNFSQVLVKYIKQLD